MKVAYRFSGAQLKFKSFYQRVYMEQFASIFMCKKPTRINQVKAMTSNLENNIDLLTDVVKKLLLAGMGKKNIFQ